MGFGSFGLAFDILHYTFLLSLFVIIEFHLFHGCLNQFHMEISRSCHSFDLWIYWILTQIILLFSQLPNKVAWIVNYLFVFVFLGKVGNFINKRIWQQSFDTSYWKLHYQPRNRNLMLNHIKKNMLIILKDVDKPESIGNLEEIWLF